ncbi:MAG TPA: MraY family glycosyltransferase [Candidatus Eisenbacteria bacterium]|nr:MraY family glycosyltransferase [Candidatus Eisenbacteria bacterium]
MTVSDSHLLLAPFAFAFALALTPAFGWLARRTGYLDHPDPRKKHAAPTPLLGGVAIAAAVVLAYLLARAVLRLHLPGIPSGVVAGAALSLFLGLIDDRHPMRPLGKMAGQIAAALCLVLWGPEVAWLRDSPLAMAAAVVVAVALLNAVNFLDAMDGVVGASFPIITLGFVLLAVVHGAPVDTALGWALIGACAGFLVYNAPPARIFLGDAGSHLLGFILAALALQSLAQEPSLPHLASVALLLAYPLFDVTFVVVDRTLRRRPIHVGGVDHTTHRLSRTCGVWGTVGVVASVAMASTGLGLWVWDLSDTQGAMAVVLLSGLAYALFGVYLRRIGPTPSFDI